MHVVGTNNARLATMLRQLAIYHAKDANNLFCVRIAQGLTHLSKGTLTLCPYHADRQIMNPVAVAGLLTFLVSCLDVKTSEYSCHTCRALLYPTRKLCFCLCPLAGTQEVVDEFL